MNRDLEETRRLVLQGLRGTGARVYLFGSWAKGNASRGSDIDVAVLGGQPVLPWVLGEIRERLEESNVLYPVDLVDLSSSSSAFREKVLAEGILWSD